MPATNIELYRAGSARFYEPVALTKILGRCLAPVLPIASLQRSADHVSLTPKRSFAHGWSNVRFAPKADKQTPRRQSCWPFWGAGTPVDAITEARQREFVERCLEDGNKLVYAARIMTTLSAALAHSKITVNHRSFTQSRPWCGGGRCPVPLAARLTYRLTKGT